MGADQGRAHAGAARAAVDLHFAEVGTVGLVVGHVEHELNGAADAPGILSDQDEAAAGGDVDGDASPEGQGVLAGERAHEADGGPACDAVEEHIGEPLKVGLVEGVKSADGNVRVSHLAELDIATLQAPTEGR
jgi:hypothetical protein